MELIAAPRRLTSPWKKGANHSEGVVITLKSGCSELACPYFNRLPWATLRTLGSDFEWIAQPTRFCSWADQVQRHPQDHFAVIASRQSLILVEKQPGQMFVESSIRPL